MQAFTRDLDVESSCARVPGTWACRRRILVGKVMADVLPCRHMRKEAMLPTDTLLIAGGLASGLTLRYITALRGGDVRPQLTGGAMRSLSLEAAAAAAGHTTCSSVWAPAVVVAAAMAADK